jgi:hypothetical protein
LRLKPVFYVSGIEHHEQLPPHLQHLAFGVSREEYKGLGEGEIVQQLSKLLRAERIVLEAQFGEKKSAEEIKR